MRRGHWAGGNRQLPDCRPPTAQCPLPTAQYTRPKITKGTKKRPYYYIVVAESTSPRDGRYIEQIGTHNPLLPKDNADRVKLDVERAKHWLSVGAQPTDRVMRFLDAAGLAKRVPPNNPQKAKPRKKRQEREAAAAAAAEGGEAKPAA